MGQTRPDGETGRRELFEEEIRRAKSVSLSGLARSLGYTPVRLGSYQSLKEMDSLIIFNDRSWYRFSGKGNRAGGSQIDFMLEYGGASSVPEAVSMILGRQCGEAKSESGLDGGSERKLTNKGMLELPERNKDMRRVFAYLVKTRCVSPNVVTFFAKSKIIYEDAARHNIVFCGMDPDGNIRYAGVHGTLDKHDKSGKTFKRDLPGSDKKYGVNIVNEMCDTIKVFESTIDCMSYMDLFGDMESNKIVLGGLNDGPLSKFLDDYAHVRKITFCLDSDDAAKDALYGRKGMNGSELGDGLVDKYVKLGYEVRVDSPSEGKDFNEMLQIQRRGMGARENKATEGRDHDGQEPAPCAGETRPARRR